MNWPYAINRHRDALLTIIVALIASLGLSDGGRLNTLPFYLYRKALRIIRPAETALRRLIMIAAYEMSLRGINIRALPKLRTTFTNFTLLKAGSTDRVPSFHIIDPLKIFGGETPNYANFGQPNINDDLPFNKTLISAASLGRRLLALKNALDNLPKQANRLARWYYQRDQARQENRPHRQSPMRPGLPLGYRKHRPNEIEEVLLDCHSLALYAREKRDSS